ncbi:MarR family winged helix-turn-helix transcriptional regulator [Oscillibacter sp. CAG:155]|uniref:MarR family winged helix-turn-helix transcriptional regulator n=1 Tax=Oscillibacter sp. CAG:155 TaxID=1262910 RepID=UPI00033BA80B|nr:myosin IC heavy chain [Oscillibacter sp. CAG:155]CDC73054.1 myosin IC heavy chain [Oscillibacter sp. CAG:155]
MPDRVELFRRIERQHIRDQLSVLGLQSVDGLVVRLLSREGQLRQEDIVLRLVLDKGSVARLEESGLAVRQVSNQCRREKLVSLSPAGEKMAEQIQVILDDWRRICLQGFTPEERVQYETFLTRIMENVKEFKEGENTNG